MGRWQDVTLHKKKRFRSRDGPCVSPPVHLFECVTDSDKERDVISIDKTLLDHNKGGKLIARWTGAPRLLWAHSQATLPSRSRQGYADPSPKVHASKAHTLTRSTPAHTVRSNASVCVDNPKASLLKQPIGFTLLEIRTPHARDYLNRVVRIINSGLVHPPKGPLSL